MVTVAEELPFAAVVNDLDLATTCSNCFARKEEKPLRGRPIDLKSCDHCGIIFYCSEECQQEDKKFHKDECQFLIKLSHPPLDTVRILSRIIMRVKRGDLPVAFNGRTFDDLMDHRKERAKNPQFQVYTKFVYEKLVEYMGAENVPTEEECASFYGKLCINGISIGSYGIMRNRGYSSYGSGIYLGISVHNHSCSPDCDYFFTGPKVTLRAKDPNAVYSKDLTISYIEIISPREIRQEKLRSDYHFMCKCKRCVDKKEDLLERSGKSTCCPEKGVVLPKENKWFYCFQQPLVCTNCGEKSDLTLEQINDANSNLRKWCDAKHRKDIMTEFAETFSPEVVNNYLKMLEDMEKILSPYNLYLLKFAEVVNIICSHTSTDRAIGIQRVLQTEAPAMEKFGNFGMEKTVITVMELNMEVHKAYRSIKSRKETMEKVDAAFEKATNILSKIYGPEYYLIGEIGEYYEYFLSNYNRIHRASPTEENEEETMITGNLSTTP